MLLNKAAAQVLRQTVAVPAKGGALTQIAQGIATDGRLTVAQAVALALTARALDGDRLAAEALAKLAADAAEVDAAASLDAELPTRTRIEVRLVDDRPQAERFVEPLGESDAYGEWEDYGGV